MLANPSTTFWKPLVPSSPTKMDQTAQLHLENKYTSLFAALNLKLDQLVYLKSLKALQSQTEEEINEKYLQVYKELPPQLTNTFTSLPASKRLDSIADFLVLQTQIVKTNALNIAYLQRVLPILQAIHVGETANSQQLLVNLNRLYSFEPPLPSSLTSLLPAAVAATSSVKKLISAYNSYESKALSSIELQIQINKYIAEDLQPKLVALQDLNHKNRDRALVLETLKRTQFAATNDNTALRAQFKEIQDLWVKISLYSEFLPGFIMASSSKSNWAENERFVDIITQSGDLGVVLNDPNHLLNINLDVEAIEQVLLKVS